MPKTKPTLHEWRQTKPWWVIGTIDDRGAIRGRPGEVRGGSPMHGVGDGNGRRWRWNVFEQEFHPAMKDNIDPEEAALVMDWLERRGYIYNE